MLEPAEAHPGAALAGATILKFDGGMRKLDRKHEQNRPNP